MTQEPPEQESAANLRDDWAALYDQYSGRVWQYVARIIGSDSNAVGDAVQETFLAAARAFHQFDPNRGTPLAWLIGIAHRQVALHWRRVGRDRIDRVSAPVEEAVVDDEVSARLDQIEMAALVRRVLAEMPADSAAILQGKYCDTQSVAELVEQFGGTTEGIRSKLARARRDFKKRYEEAVGEKTAPVPLKNFDTDRT